MKLSSRGAILGWVHAKVANPPTLLTRFAEELRRAPVAGGGRGIFDVGCFPEVAGHAHAWIFDYL